MVSASQKSCYTIENTKNARQTCIYVMWISYAKSRHIFWWVGWLGHGQLGLSLAFPPYYVWGQILVSTKGPACKLYYLELVLCFLLKYSSVDTAKAIHPGSPTSDSPQNAY